MRMRAASSAVTTIFCGRGICMLMIAASSAATLNLVIGTFACLREFPLLNLVIEASVCL